MPAPGRTYGSLSVRCRLGAGSSERSRSSATRVIEGELDTFTAHNKAGRPRQAASVCKLFDLKEVPPWTHLLPGFSARRVF